MRCSLDAWIAASSALGIADAQLRPTRLISTCYPGLIPENAFVLSTPCRGAVLEASDILLCFVSLVPRVWKRVLTSVIIPGASTRCVPSMLV
jgi:hypothetical protein